MELSLLDVDFLRADCKCGRIQGWKISAQAPGQNRIAQGEVQRGFEKAGFIASVVVGAFKAISVDRRGMAASHKRIGQLQLAAEARFQLVNAFEDLGIENVAAEDA